MKKWIRRIFTSLFFAISVAGFIQLLALFYDWMLYMSKEFGLTEALIIGMFTITFIASLFALWARDLKVAR